MTEAGNPDRSGRRQPASYLFVPGNRPDRVAKAAASGADSIIIDLEDAVGPDDKEAARAAAADWFRQGGGGVLRINGADTPWFTPDLAALAAYPAAVVMVPKASVAALNDVSRRLPGRPLIALVESVEGLMQLHDLAAAPGLCRIAFGNLDFGLDARIPGTGASLDPVRLQIAIASRHAGLPPPVDGVTVDLEDMGALAADVARARDLGFTAKLCLHPRQVAAVNCGFAPTEAEIDRARRIVAAVRAAKGGVVQLDGRMIDRPVVERARAVLDAAGEGP
ncbi:HpcH/HpaI aldolase/citrate lyase family protein [Rhizobium sp. GN54]|uniref:HpcH/HpaI aldolase/citrate lyase family protein n=1 Tax=Rhizobium sp. GN54 TaxID=2898150 RepID=UPI001E601822|nr:CoA ester lyase [Rhizobium sp. GN54]MCD2185297.1 CoA ester lyase [Rhizobium sp. GN54]